MSAPSAAVEERYGENLGVGQSADVFVGLASPFPFIFQGHVISESALALGGHADGELAPPSVTMLDLLLVLRADGRTVGWPDTNRNGHGSGTPEEARLGSVWAQHASIAICRLVTILR